MELRIAKLSKTKKMIQFEKLTYEMVVAPKPEPQHLIHNHNHLSNKLILV